MAAVKKIFISLYFKLLKHLVLQKLTINKKNLYAQLKLFILCYYLKLRPIDRKLFELPIEKNNFENNAFKVSILLFNYLLEISIYLSTYLSI